MSNDHVDGARLAAMMAPRYDVHRWEADYLRSDLTRAANFAYR